jgi:hypothetical protein
MRSSTKKCAPVFAVLTILAMAATLPSVAVAEERPPATTSTTATTTPDPSTSTSEPAPVPTTIPPVEAPAGAEESEPLAVTSDPESAEVGSQATPTVVVTPSTDLLNNQTVVVTGSGFAANASIGGAVCNDVGEGGNACDTGNVLLTTANATGGFSVEFTVRRILHTANGTVDCASAVQVCHFGVANLANQEAEHVNVPLGFDTTAPLPPPPTLLAGPTTGLVDGESIALFGAKFVASVDVYFFQCVQPGVQTSCMYLGSTLADANGGFITTMSVHRVVMQLPFLSVDCAAAPDDCSLVATSAADQDVTQSVGLSFDPNGPAPIATVTVTPNANLLNNQSVMLAGSGFEPGGFVNATQCKTGATTPADCNFQGVGVGLVAADGTFAGTFIVRRILNLPSGGFDCASSPGACSIVMNVFGQAPIVVSTSVSFDPNVPLPPPPAITIAPATGLVDRQLLNVSGVNFAPNTFVQLNECLTSSTDPYCSPFSFGGFVETDSTGSFATTFSARRGIRTFTFDDPVVDCASSAGLCSLFALSEYGDRAHGVLDFDPNAPIPTTTVTVTPDRDLPDRAVVTVHGEGFAPHDQVFVNQCTADDEKGPFVAGCGSGAFSSIGVDDSGRFDYTLRVHRELGGFGFTPTNCAASFGACVVRVSSVTDPFADSAVPLGFDPTAVAPGPTITITPAAPYAGGQRVTVHGSGFTPNAPLGLAQCIADSDYAGNTCDTVSRTDESAWGRQEGGLFDQFFADDHGEFTRTISLHTSFQTTTQIVDCLTQPNGCVLFAANREDYGDERTAVPLVFGTSTVVVPPGRPLAFTGAGSTTRPLAVAGIAAVLVGFALIALQRRRPGTQP